MKTVSSLFLVMVKDPLRDLRLSIPHPFLSLFRQPLLVQCFRELSLPLLPSVSLLPKKSLSAFLLSSRPCQPLSYIPALFFFRAPISFLVAYTRSFFGSFCFSLSTHIHTSVMELEFSSRIFAPAPCRFFFSIHCCYKIVVLLHFYIEKLHQHDLDLEIGCDSSCVHTSHVNFC